MDNFDFSYDGDHGNHFDPCGCHLTLIGKSAVTDGIAYTTTKCLKDGAWNEALAYVTSNFDSVGDTLVRVAGDAQSAGIIAGLRYDSNISIVSPPWTGYPDVQSGIFYDPPPGTVTDLRKADFLSIKDRVPCITWPQYLRAVESEMPHTGAGIWSLGNLALRSASMYRRIYKLKNNRPPVILANAMLDGFKMTKAILKTNKDVHVLPENARAIMSLLPAAMPHLYRMLGTEEHFASEECILTFDDCRGMYLGSAGGTIAPHAVHHVTSSGVQVYQTTNGKKAITIEPACEHILEFLSTGKEWQTIVTNCPKNEHYYGFNWQETPLGDDEWERWLQKVRLYMIPDVSFIVVERLVSMTRMLHERGKVIQIGMKWARGGMDRIAKCLGVDRWNEWVKMLEDGDISGLDSSIAATFLNLYYSATMVYEKKTRDYVAKRKLLEFCIRQLISRLTRMVRDLFGIVIGGMPSGALNTSHGNSWIMLLWFCLFAVLQIIKQPTQAKMILCEAYFVEQIKIIIYGDDFVVTAPPHAFREYFTSVAFKLFLKVHLNVEMRDERSGLTFLSEQHNGWLTVRGMIFLKHQAVLNPDKSAGQARYLPYRETHEYLIRVLYGRDGRQRDDTDVALSIIGHAYGTYGSNLHAYHFLRHWFSCIISRMGEWKLPDDRLPEQSLRKYRQAGISRDEFIRGFPSLDVLRQKNVYDSVYHENTMSHVRSSLDVDGLLA